MRDEELLDVQKQDASAKFQAGTKLIVEAMNIVKSNFTIQLMGKEQGVTDACVVVCMDRKVAPMVAAAANMLIQQHGDIGAISVIDVEVKKDGE